MGIEELFGQGRNQQRQGYGQQYGQDDEYQTSRPFSQQNDIKEQFLNKLRDNPKLKMILIVTAVLIVLVVIAVVILIFPLLLKLLNYISTNGIQGVLDAIWKGSK
jgi:hypothetical protein